MTAPSCDGRAGHGRRRLPPCCHRRGGEEGFFGGEAGARPAVGSPEAWGWLRGGLPGACPGGEGQGRAWQGGREKRPGLRGRDRDREAPGAEGAALHRGRVSGGLGGVFGLKRHPTARQGVGEMQFEAQSCCIGFASCYTPLGSTRRDGQAPGSGQGAEGAPPLSQGAWKGLG